MSGSKGLPTAAGLKNDMTIAGGQVLGDEYTDHVVKVSTALSQIDNALTLHLL